VDQADVGHDDPEGYSSRGLLTRRFDASGSALPTPQVRQKPNVAGADNVNTTVPNFQPFRGTSAATPSVAGIAALLRSANTTLTVPQLYAALTNPANTIDCNAAGNPDADCGFGFVLADRAVAQVLTSTPTEVTVEGKGHIGVDHPAYFEIDDVRRSSSGVLKGDFEFKSRSRRLEFESTAILTLARLHNTAQFTGTGELNERGGYTFTVSVVDMRHDRTKPSRISVEIRNSANVVVYSSNGLRHVYDGKIEIDDTGDNNDAAGASGAFGGIQP
jgi:hypothetical protein